MKPFRLLFVWCALAVLSASVKAEDYPLAKSFAKYQAIAQALAADDYFTAKEGVPAFLEELKSELGDKAAPKLVRSAEQLATVDSLQKARERFADVSGRFSNLTEAYPNHGGYYTCVCTSVPGNLQFVQREKDITKCPYGGRANPTCGRVLSQK